MGRKKVIQLPKGYLSQSQVSLWLSNPERYKHLYFDGDDSYRFTNAGMEYGKEVATALENGEESDDLLTNTAMELLPKYDIPDKEFTTILKTKDGEIVLLGRPDSLDSKTKSFYEFKTGKFKWTQKLADKSFQLKFYATMLYNEYKVVPPTIKLVWMETYRDADGKTLPTGHIESFEVKIGPSIILDTMRIISQVAKEIEAEWVIHTPAPKIPF